MPIPWLRSQRRSGSRSAPMDAASLRLLVAAAVGVLILMIWLTGMLGDSRRVTMLALSAVSLLGLGLVLELRRRYVAEQMAKASERRYRFLAEHSFDMIVRFDPQTQRRTYVSPACRQLYGYEPEELLAASLDEIVHPDDLHLLRDAVARPARSRDQPTITYRARRKDGSYIWAEANMTWSVDPLTGAPEIVAVVRDVSERVGQAAVLRRAKEAADNANRAKSQFLATMSHELRTPLNSIIGFAEMMQTEVMGPVGNDQYRSYVTDIHTSGTHLLQLINDILDLTRAEAGMLDLHEEAIDVGAIVRDITRLCRASIEKAELNVIVELPPLLPQLRADERRVRQVLFNLVGNAVKFTPEGGRLTISAHCEPKARIAIVVADTGVGIARKDLARVVEPFVQIDNPMTRRHAGTGLGLAAVRAIMDAHGGTLELESTLGLGTKAAVTFPSARTIEGDSRATARPAA